MPVMDEFREEREAVKNGSFKDKAKYFWCYYKWHTFIGLVVIFFVVLLIRDVTSQKDNAFFAVLLNCYETDTHIEDISSCESGFVEYAGIDTDTYDVIFDTTIHLSEDSMDEMSVTSSQRMMVYTAAAELDVIVGSSDIFPEYANSEMLCDLREILSEEQLTRYAPYLYYVDWAVVEAIDEAEYNLEDYETPDYPDPTRPEEMEDPVPVGLFVTDCEKLTDSYLFGGDYSALGVMVNSPNLENSLKFIDYLFE